MLRRIVATVLIPIVPLAAACTAVAPIRSPGQFVSTHQPPRLWITRSDNSVVLLESPKAVGDTLAGFVEGQYVEVPLANVRQVRARRAVPSRTALLVGAGVVAAAGMALVITGSGGGGGSGLCTDKFGNVTPC